MAVVAVAAFVGWRYFDGRIVRLTPEAIAELKEAVAAQDEAATPLHRAAREVAAPNPMGNVYFGDLHVHTALSFDAYLFGNRNGLDEAYAFANGADLEVVNGETAWLSRPLDFVALTDHAESFALPAICADDPNHPFCLKMNNPSVFLFQELRSSALDRPPKRPASMCEVESLCVEAEKATWQRIREAAERHNDPGTFTAFTAYEYSPVLPEAGKAHRNVIFRNEHVPEHAASSYDAVTTPDLWRTLERDCQAPCEALTIPHNMNKMWGVAYNGKTIDGDDYSREDWRVRADLEPLAEIFQIKGASECAVAAGAVDEECTFEQILPACEPGQEMGCALPNSFARQGLKNGLGLQAQLGFNPLRFGFVGATDTHNSTPGDAEEWDSRGSNGLFGSPASKRLAAPDANYKSGIMRNPGGLAAVWAEENTRDKLFDAMKRRETYATSGTRIRLRFFAGALPSDLHENDRAIEIAHEQGHPMGSVLAANEAPVFFASALQDPFSAPLDRLQVVKGWWGDGETHESVMDVACSGGRQPVEGRCPDNGARVDLSTCAFSSDVGDAELNASWQDAEFVEGQPAFYYVRVLENPTCRWSTYDALRLGVSPRDDVDPVVKERAWSSPIWVTGAPSG